MKADLEMINMEKSGRWKRDIMAIHKETVKQLRASLIVGRKIKVSEQPSIYGGGRPCVTEGMIMAKCRKGIVVELTGGYKTFFKYVTLLCKGVRWEQK